MWQVKILLGGFTIHSLQRFGFKEMNIKSKLLIVAQLTEPQKNNRSEGTPGDHLVHPLAQRRVHLKMTLGYTVKSFILWSTRISVPTACVHGLLSFGWVPLTRSWLCHASNTLIWRLELGFHLLSLLDTELKLKLSSLGHSSHFVHHLPCQHYAMCYHLNV